jgi:hypothetical protein
VYNSRHGHKAANGCQDRSSIASHDYNADKKQVGNNTAKESNVIKEEIEVGMVEAIKLKKEGEIVA